MRLSLCSETVGGREAQGGGIEMLQSYRCSHEQTFRKIPTFFQIRCCAKGQK